VNVDFPQPPPVVFGYLTDPRNRPEWQAGLRRVEEVDGTGEVGTTWVDVTAVGARPRLRVTEQVRDAHWVETGSWRGIDATVTLGFTPHDGGTRVYAALAITPRHRASRPLVAVLGRLAPAAVRRDLERAVRRIG